MNQQQSDKECRNEQINTEEPEKLPVKEEKKTSEQIEVQINSSTEMSSKTNSDLLRTSIAPEPIIQMSHLDQIFQLEPDGSRPTFQQAERRAKEFAEEVATTANIVAE